MTSDQQRAVRRYANATAFGANTHALFGFYRAGQAYVAAAGSEAHCRRYQSPGLVVVRVADLVDVGDVSEWDAPRCLRWLADHTGEDNYRYRADNWQSEVGMFAASEDVDPEEWEDSATAELQQGVRKLMAELLIDTGAGI